MKSILYVTSFNERLFNLSALRLLYSFIRHNMNAKLLICYEDENETNYLKELKNQKNPKFIFINISKYEYLTNFLKDHKDIIYKEYGGTAESKSYWNDKWSLWFRKIASLKYALNNFPKFNFIVWVDCDCIFKKHLNNKFLINGFHKKDCFYYLGPYRRRSSCRLAAGVETGFIGWRRGEGYKLLSEIINEFNDRKFTKHARWDDGYVIRKVIEKTKVKCIDLADLFEHVGGNVIGNLCYFRNHILHNKGSHHYKSKISFYAIKDPKKLKKELVKLLIQRKNEANK